MIGKPLSHLHIMSGVHWLDVDGGVQDCQWSWMVLIVNVFGLEFDSSCKLYCKSFIVGKGATFAESGFCLGDTFILCRKRIFDFPRIWYTWKVMTYND